MNDDFWANLTQQLALVRKRKTLLLRVSYAFGFAGLFAVCVVAAAFGHDASTLDWPWMIVAVVCVAFMLGIQAFIDYTT